MKVDRLALAGSFCWNKGCRDYGKVDYGNLVRYGRTGKGTQRIKGIHLTRVQLDAMWIYVGHKGEKATILKNQIEEDL
jgi:hypothetical protein